MSIIKYSPSLPDQCGSQIHDDLFAYAYCFNNGLIYGGSTHPNWVDLRTELCEYLSLPIPCVSNVPNLEHSQYREGQCGLEIDKIFNQNFLNHLRSNCNFSKQPKKKTICIHIRRGDVDCDEGWKSERYLSSEYYISLLDSLVKIFPEHQVIIHSQYNFWNEASLFDRFNPQIKIEIPLIEVWEDFITSEVFVMSKSSFSYVPALFNNGLVLYTPFWHNPIKNWIDVSQSNWSTYIQ